MAEPVPTLGQLAGLFLRLGATAFGGPAAHIALMEDEVVHRRRWLTREQFLDLLAATNLIPGPNSTEMAIHVGRLAGWWGFLIAGVCFILPAALLVGVLAWAYTRFGTLPEVRGILYGVKPIVIAVVLQALWRLGRDSLKSPWLAVVAVVAVLAAIFRINEILILLGGGVLAVAASRPRTLCLAVVPVPLVAVAPPVGLSGLFLVFLKIGAVLFGSGYVLLAFLRADLVERLHWLSEQQLLDAVAVGQVTPGPVFTTATFIGYLIHGPAGAVVATVGIFLPAFFFVAISGPLIPRLRKSPIAGAVMDGVVVASLALMAVVTWELGRAALADLVTCVLALIASVLLFCYRVNATWLILGGALVGWIITAW